jgi:hypothetical protein
MDAHMIVADDLETPRLAVVAAGCPARVGTRDLRGSADCIPLGGLPGSRI